MIIKRRLAGLLTVLLTVVMAAGCAGSGGKGYDVKNAVKDFTDVSLASELTQIEGDQLYMGEYIRLSIKDAVPAWKYEDRRLYADAYDGVIYILAEYRSGEEELSRQFFLTKYAYGTTEFAWEPFYLDFPEREGWSIRSMAMPKAGELSFRVTDKDKNGELRYFLVVTDLQGNQLSLAENLPDEKEYPWNSEDAPYGDHVARGADGSLAACMSREGKTRFYSYDPESGDREEIEISADVPYVRTLYPEGNKLYYVDNKYLFRWDRAAKKLTDLIPLEEINFPTGSGQAFLLPGGQGRLLLCALGTNMFQVFCLSEEEYQPEDEIRMAVLKPSGLEYTLEAAVEYSYAHWNCPINTERAEEGEEEAFRNRVMAQIAAGEGPDLMLLSAEDMLILAEKGALMDLTELIPAETMGQLFPCVIENGTVDGKLVGMMTRLYINTMITADNTWPGDSWNLDEFLQLLEAKEEWNRPIGEYILYLDPMRCLKAILPDLCHSRFLDIDGGTARFECEEFIRILEICRQYEGRAEEYWREEPESNASIAQRMIDGEYISCPRWIMDLHSFSNILSEYDGKAHLVGYPAEGGGHFAGNNFHFVAVNANTKHKEEIKDFFAALLSYDRQFAGSRLYLSIRGDVIRDTYIVVDGVSKEIVTIDGQTILSDMRYLKPDGSTYLEEFLEFLNSCRAEPKWPPQIEQILEEELEPYFQGDKSAEEAVALLQNRVQLYLDEQ